MCNDDWAKNLRGKFAKGHSSKFPRRIFVLLQKKKSYVSFENPHTPPRLNPKPPGGGGPDLGAKNIDFSKIVQYVPKWRSRAIFFQNFHYSALKNSKLPFKWSKLSNKFIVFFFKISIFFTFLRWFWPPKSKKSRFFQNHPKWSKMTP